VYAWTGQESRQNPPNAETDKVRQEGVSWTPN